MRDRLINILLLWVISVLCIFILVPSIYASTKDVYIKDVVVEKKDGSTVVTTNPSYSGMNIKLALKFYGINDSIRYKVTVDNPSDEDVIISDKGTITDASNDYIKYEFGWEDTDNVVKANTSKDFYIDVTYVKEVPDSGFDESGKFIEDRVITVKLEDEVNDNTDTPTVPDDQPSDDNQDNNEVNKDNQVDLVPTPPKTGDNIIKYVILLLVALLGLIILSILILRNRGLDLKKIFKKNINKYSVGLFIIVVLLIVGVIGYTLGLEQVEITMNSRVEIEQTRLAMSCNADSYSEGFCIDWNKYVDYSKYPEGYTASLITTKTKNMEDIYTSEDGVVYKLSNTYDVSDKQNNQVILGVYYDESGKVLLNIGQDNGVLSPIDSSYLFAAGCAGRHYIEPQSNNKFSNKVTLLEFNEDDAFNERCYYIGTNIMEVVSYLDLGNLIVDDSTNMYAMFANNGYGPGTYEKYNIIGFSKWDTSNVTNMSNMFNSTGYYSNDFKLDLLNFDTSSVVDMSGMFYAIGNRSDLWNIGDISNWNVSNVMNMKLMFSDAGTRVKEFELNLTNWDTSNVIDMSGMFLETANRAERFELNLTNWDTSNVTNMSCMFIYTGNNASIWNIGDISKWDTSNVTDMSGMFSYSGENAEEFELNLTNWDTSKVTDMSDMFYGTANIAVNFELNLSNWDTSKVTDMSGMFWKTGEYSSSWSIGDLSNWDTSNVTDMSNMFNSTGENASSWSIGNVSNWDTSKVTDMSSMFLGTGKYIEKFELNLTNWDTSNVTDMSGMFMEAGLDSSIWSIGDISNWNVSKVTDMSYMFNDIGKNVETFKLNLSNWNTSNVTDMGGMFNGAGENALVLEVDLSSWDTSKVTDMFWMFSDMGSNCQNSILKLNNFTFDIVNNFSWIFRNVSNNLEIYVKSEKERDWILNLSSRDRPSAWSTSNILIANS